MSRRSRRCGVTVLSYFFNALRARRTLFHGCAGGFALLLGAVSLPIQAATYSYTGTTYDIIVNNTTCTIGNCPATYTAAMHVTGSFTTASPLAANLSNVDVSALVTSYSFTDGINTIANSDPNARIDDFHVSTNSSGAIVSTYSIVFDRWTTGTSPHGAGNRLNEISLSNANSDAENDEFCVIVSTTDSADACNAFGGDSNASSASSSTPGAWVMTGGPGPAAGIFWTDEGNLKIETATLTGTGIKDVVTTGLTAPAGVAVDVAGGKIYWTNADKIQRGNLDGSSVETLVTGQSDAFGIALDLATGKIYWVDFFQRVIRRANLDGTTVETLVSSGLVGPLGIALDTAGGKMYWTDTVKIQRANLDGTGIQNLVTAGLSQAQGIAIDPGRGKIYWTDNAAHRIQRANLDGTNVLTLVTGLGQPTAIALDLAHKRMYWTDAGTLKIQRARLNGKHIKTIISTGLSDPVAITVAP